MYDHNIFLINHRFVFLNGPPVSRVNVFLYLVKNYDFVLCRLFQICVQENLSKTLKKAVDDIYR